MKLFGCRKSKNCQIICYVVIKDFGFKNDSKKSSLKRFNAHIQIRPN